MDLKDWPDCDEPLCINKVCTWLGEGKCYIHSILDDAEKDRRYKLTHDKDNYLYSDYGLRLIKEIK